MKILITGANGQLGYELALALKDHQLILTDRKSAIDGNTLDITNGEAVYKCLEEHQPDVVINTAAYTQVDQAQADPDTVFEINRDGAMNLAEASLAIKAKFIHISTDYVFDGLKGSPYTEDDQVNPQNVYGESKLAGEVQTMLANPDAVILRTAWLYGGVPKFDQESKASHSFKNFINSILIKATQGKDLRVVDDQFGCPTFAGDLAQVIKEVIEKDIEPGIYHAVNAGSTSWFGLAQEILKQAQLKTKLEAIDSTQITQPAKRPPNTVLSTDKLKSRGITLPMWQEGLKSYLKRK